MSGKGFTLIEMVVATVIIGIVALVMAATMRNVMRQQVYGQAQADLDADATTVVQTLTVALAKAGDGVPNSATPGYSIFVTTISDASSITFFSKDDGDHGQMGYAADQWTRYSLQDGLLLKEIFAAGASTQITPSVRISSAVVRLSPETRIEQLQFNFYSSGTSGGSAPQQITDAHAASYARLHFQLVNGPQRLSRDSWFYLSNLINARQTP